MLDGRKLPFLGDADLDYTPEQRAELKKMWAACEPISDKKIGTILVFGTGGGLLEGNMNTLFFSPENFKTKKQ